MTDLRRRGTCRPARAIAIARAVSDSLASQADRCQHPSCSIASDSSLSPDSCRSERMPTTAESGHLQPSCAASADGSLSPDSCRPGQLPMTAEMGHKLPLALQKKIVAGASLLTIKRPRPFKRQGRLIACCRSCQRDVPWSCSEAASASLAGEKSEQSISSAMPSTATMFVFVVRNQTAFNST
jgi:hypothetical protein